MTEGGVAGYHGADPFGLRGVVPAAFAAPSGRIGRGDAQAVRHAVGTVHETT